MRYGNDSFPNLVRMRHSASALINKGVLEFSFRLLLVLAKATTATRDPIKI